MLYRYRMHWIGDLTAPLGQGRALFARTAAEAIAHAADLWKTGAYASSLGYRVVDTEDGAVLLEQHRDPSPPWPPDSRSVASAQVAPPLARFGAVAEARRLTARGE